MPATTPLPTPQQRLTFQHLYWDVFWFGVLQGSAIAFLSIYAARIGATALQVGLLTSGPAVINLLASLPAGRWMEGRRMTRVAFLTSLWNRAGYLLLIPLPWLVPAAVQVWALPAIVVLMAIPGTALAIAFNAMFADVVAPEWRAHVVGRRSALLAVSSTVTSLVCGQLLDLVAAPLNYQWVFAIGAVGAALSCYYLGRIQAPASLPPRVGRPLLDMVGHGAADRPGEALPQRAGLRFLTRGGARSLLRVDLLRGPFGLVMAAYLAFYTFQYTSIPLMPVYWVRNLGLTNGEISIGNAMFWATLLVTSLRLSWLTERLGHRRLLVIGALFFGQYPALNALANDAGLYYLASAIGGVVWGLTGAGLVNRLMERVPENDRPGHMALHNLALNLGILLGSFVGPWLGEALDLRAALYVAAILRLVGGLLLWRWA